ncbi:hypothetical protein BDW59DRAFT_167454 [Aspergillus cavernicola]|uniref:NRPS-like enzyme n=1 Tax=Aspergillus cavernicola TaxID=176166 RepID=A0ABR4HDT4_9EURO
MAHRQQLRPFQRPVIKLYPTADETGYIRTLPEVIEFNAQTNPHHVFCIQAKKKPDVQVPSLIAVSNFRLKQAISRCAEWLRRNLSLELPTIAEDGAVSKGAPVALLMESDLGLWLHEMALIGLGVPVLLISARLSATAVHSLLQHTSASAIIASRRLEGTAQKAAQSLPVYSPNSVETFLSADHGLPDDASICHPHHYIDENDRDVLILHSSGTTGLPKPIYVSHRHLLSYVNCHRLDIESDAQGVSVSTLPLYHGFGLLAPGLAMGVGKTVCFPPGSTVPSAGSTLDLIKAARAASLMTVPSIMENIALMGDSGIQPLAQLDFVTFGGGILKPAIGSCLSGYGVRLLNHYGTTESGPLSPIFVPGDDYNWRFFRLRDDVRLHLEEIAPEGTERRFKLTTFPFGWGRPFEIQDQLVCNPDSPGSDFDAVGRNDDTIVLATGEKVQPQLLEVALCGSSLVKTAVAFGEHQFEIGVLVQPATELSPENYHGFKQQLWPLVLQAREKMDEHARIQSIEAILIVPSTVTLARTDKGSIARKDVYKMFETEVAQVYRNLESAGPVQSLHLDTLEHNLKSLISSCVDWSPDWEDEDDVFERGMNSLQAIRVRRALVVAVTRSLQGICRPEHISRDFVYSHPSVRLMADFFRNAASGLANGDSPGVDFFVQSFALSKRTKSSERPGSVVLLTGATGSLGSHCLVSLTLSPHVNHIVCLIRPDKNSSTDPRSRLERSLDAKRLHLSADRWCKVDIIECSTTTEHLGLTPEQYTSLQHSVTHILHMAWPMDFHWQLPSFQSQFQTLHNLLALGRDIHDLRPSIKPRLSFISSIAVVGQYAHVHGGRIVPETPINSVKCLSPFGYAEAKLVCERMLEHARVNLSNDLEVSFIRLGQIAGSSDGGFWNTNEHFPALVVSSRRIGALPQLPNTLSWIPVDQAAESVVELALSNNPLDLVYHIENPVRQSWHDLLEIIATELDIKQTLPLDQWLERVWKAPDEGNPAKKLYEFFVKDFLRMACGEVIMGTDAARRDSATLRDMDVVQESIVRQYVQYWKDVGAFNNG